MTTMPFVSPYPCRLYSAPASPVPKSFVRSRIGVAFPARPCGFLLRPRSLVMAAAGVGGNGSPAAHEDSTVSSRFGEVNRVTKETNVHVKINLDGTGVADCSTGIPFSDHMLDAEGATDVVIGSIWRPHLSFGLIIPTERAGTYDTQLSGKNPRHIIEASFKAFARALRQAT